MPDYDAHAYQPPAPVAKVAIRTVDGKKVVNNVPMLIDSGSDVTLIPDICIRHLDLEAVQKQNYQLIGFDGSISLARSTECELLFLHRAFLGVYLVTDDATGILGRDVLNHLSLVLDGPRLIWHEETIAK